MVSWAVIKVHLGNNIDVTVNDSYEYPPMKNSDLSVPAKRREANVKGFNHALLNDLHSKFSYDSLSGWMLKLTYITKIY